MRETLFTVQKSMACYCKMMHFDVYVHTDTSKGDVHPLSSIAIVLTGHVVILIGSASSQLLQSTQVI